MKTSRISLVGMPGSGKSTLGKKIADHFGLPFLDLDHIIETQENQSIKEIFNVHKEKGFREIERAQLQKVVKENAQFVMSTGGGTPCFFDNMDIILTNGVTVFINTPLSSIVERLDLQEAAKRPLISKMSDRGLEKSLKLKLDARLEFYNRAHVKIKGDESIEFISSVINDFEKKSEIKS